MRDRLLWNRRDFVQMAGSSSLGVMTARLPWPSPISKENNRADPRFAYVACAGKSGGAADCSEHEIKVFAIKVEHWRPIGSVVSDHPSFLTLHPSGRLLYAVNEVNRYENLPSGSVEAYAIDAKDGSLTLLNRQPLSLSAILPRHMAVSPDGRALVVAVHGGGAYNVLPIDKDGRLGRVSGILKETGSGPDKGQQAAHPQMVMFDRMGRLLSADLGNDRLSVFTLNDCSLSVASRREVRAGSGPRQMDLHPSGNLLFVANGLDASVSCYRYDQKNGRILEQLEHVPTVRDSGSRERCPVVMAMHPSGEFLYNSHRSGSEGITVWRSNSITGALHLVQHEGDEFQALQAMTMAPDGSSLLALSRKSGSVVRWRVDRGSGRLTEPVRVAQVPEPMSMVVKYL